VLYVGDALEVLRTLPDESVQCCCTSPPYWGLRDYGTGTWEGGDPECDHRSPTMREGRNEDRPKLAGSDATNAAQLRLAHRSACGKCGAVKVDLQLGLESTPEEYVAKMVTVFGQVRRVLRDDGTLWLNLGDSYNSIGHKKSSSGYGTTGLAGGQAQEHHPLRRENSAPGLKHKDLVGIPWRVAFALQADGWYLRSDIIWSKPNPMPESVTDRPTKAHEYVFLFSKNQMYFYDADAIAEPSITAGDTRHQRADNTQRARERKQDMTGNRRYTGFNDRYFGSRKDTGNPTGQNRNARTVWEITTKPYSGAHFATMPPELASRCIKAGSKPTDTVLDPFGGSGTTASVATGLGRNAIHIDLNPDLSLAIDRIGPMLVDVKEVAA